MAAEWPGPVQREPPFSFTVGFFGDFSPRKMDDVRRDAGFKALRPIILLFKTLAHFVNIVPGSLEWKGRWHFEGFDYGETLNNMPLMTREPGCTWVWCLP